jgi:hypothetical protein
MNEIAGRLSASSLDTTERHRLWLWLCSVLKMVKYGLLLDVAGFVVIVPCATWRVPWLMKM